jgi:hypothetical protein
MPRSYPPEFRRKVLDLVNAGRPVRKVAADIGGAAASIPRRVRRSGIGVRGWYPAIGMAVGICGWSFRSVSTVGVGGSAGAATRPAAPRSRRCGGCGRRGRAMSTAVC